MDEERTLYEDEDFELRLAGYKKREQQKKDAYYILQSANATPDQQIKAAEMLFEAWYWRSAALNHPSYPDFVAMILNQGNKVLPDEVPDGIYKALTEKYGTKKGIDYGSYYLPESLKERR